LIFAFSGFEAVVVTGGEMKDPRRDVPFALLVAIAVASLLYLLIQTVCIGTLPDLVRSQKPLADASLRFMGAAGASVITFGARLSALGTFSGSMLVSPRLLFAMAGHHEVPPVLGRTSERFRTPHAAIVLTGLAGIGLALSGTFTHVITVSVIARLLSYVGTAA